jgi:hypothetical protein
MSMRNIMGGLQLGAMINVSTATMADAGELTLTAP